MPTIKLKKATSVDHRDPDGAGFTAGWRWTVDAPHGTVESFAATKGGAEAAARAVLLPVVDDVKVVER